jgi:geranylgeranyl reductase family protein
MDTDVIIVGGGPAGASAATSLAQNGVSVLLLEEKRMPRHKVCGEFITPESFPILERLRVADAMLESGAQQIRNLALIASKGTRIDTPIEEMSNVKAAALSLSRARLDQILFERAKQAGATCLEGVAVKECLFDAGRPSGVEALSLAEGKRAEFKARFVVDASGRNSRLTLSRNERAGRKGSRAWALKAHFRNVEGLEDRVDLYFFPEGYGGLSRIEDGLVNICFIVSERALRNSHGDPAKTFERTLKKHPVAAKYLRFAEVEGAWLSVGPLTFGPRRLSQKGMLIAGDASGMIDPFTGTGIQIALRTGELVAEAITEALESSKGGALEVAHSIYREGYSQEFGNRMRVAGALRRAAFSPWTANLLGSVLSQSPSLTRYLLRATRS